MRRTRTDADVVLLRDAVLFGENALLRLVVELHRPAEVLLGAYAHGLALLQRHVVEDVHLEGATQPLVLLLDVHRQTITASFSCTLIGKLVQISVVYLQK